MKRDNKIAKKVLAILLASTTIGTAFTGCSKDEDMRDNSYILDNTILDKSMVVFVDDQPIVMRYYDCYYGFGKYCNNFHYEDIISGRIYHIKGNDARYSSEVCGNNECISLDPQTKIESITPYLTQEEIQKAMGGNLTDNDIIAIEQRIVKTK